MTVQSLGLRPYQERTIGSLYAAYGSGRRRVPIVLPTGGGKTVVFARAVADCAQAGGSALVLAHRTELIDQAEEKLRGNTAQLDVGVLQGRRREFHARAVVSSMQTAVRPGALSLLRQRGFRLVVVDETHHIAAPSYQTILRELGVFRPDGPLLLGVTATLGRGDRLALSDTFDGPPAEVVEMRELVAGGWLLPPKGIRVKVAGLDLTGVRASRTSESGLDDKAVAQALSAALAPAAIARAVLEHGKGRRGVAFLPSVELSREMARVFCEHGIKAIHVDADTPKAVRKEIVRRARLGEYDMVCNVGLFTEGTDVPVWDLVVLARPTSSPILFVQMAGRAMRPYPGQADCLVLDVVGVTGRHRLQSVVAMDGVEMIDELDEELKQFEPDEEEAEPRESASEQADPDPGADGPLVHELVDLFSASHTAWQHSPKGVWYLPTGGGSAVFLAPSADVDRYEVRSCVTGSRDAVLLHEACDLSAAMGWGDKEARNIAKRDLDRAADWRPKRLTRAERVAAIYRGEVPGGADMPMNRGALMDAMDARWAAEHIDGLACVAEVSPSGYWTT